MSSCSARKLAISARSEVISVGGIRSLNSVTNSFSGALRTWNGSFTTKRLGMDALKNMRRGDVGHVERRVLAHQHHIRLRKIADLRLSQSEMVAFGVAHYERCVRAR